MSGNGIFLIRAQPRSSDAETLLIHKEMKTRGGRERESLWENRRTGREEEFTERYNMLQFPHWFSLYTLIPDCLCLHVKLSDVPVPE